MSSESYCRNDVDQRRRISIHSPPMNPNDTIMAQDYATRRTPCWKQKLLRQISLWPKTGQVRPECPNILDSGRVNCCIAAPVEALASMLLSSSSSLRREGKV